MSSRESLFSSSWYRIADLRPRVRSHGRIHRHRYRGELWYVLQDVSSERVYRFSPGAYKAIGLMDGKRSVQDIWEIASEQLGDDAPTQDEMIQLLGQLHAADMLQTNVAPDTAEVLKRHAKQSRRRWVQQLLSPLFWRFPLFDPGRFLDATVRYVRPLFTPLAFLVWLGVVFAGVFLIVMHWGDLTEGIVDRVMSPQNLVVLWLLFPILKGFHEFGHAYAVRAYGGQVHEMGVMLLVLTPLPYVDASAATSFVRKRERLVVGAAGMMVEVFIASLALFLWLSVEPGALRTICYNIVFIAGVSTILFNINPLLRFDGYYILADLLEIPNLRARSFRYLGYLVERYAFGRKDSVAPARTRSERAWFTCFGIASFVYRILIFVGIGLFIAGKFFFVGVLLALWGALTWGLLPLVKGVHHVFTSPRLRKVRFRAVSMTLGAVAAAVVLIGWVPAPLNTLAEGVIWVPDEAVVRARTDGLVRDVLVAPGSEIAAGDPVIACEDSLTAARLRVVEAEVRELLAEHDKVRFSDPVRGEVILQELAHRRKDLARQRERLEELTIRSPVAGTLAIPQPEDLPGRFLKRGTAVAQVLNRHELTARVVVSQEQIHLVRNRLEDVHVRLADALGEVRDATIRRIVPAGSETLPRETLGTAGGGKVVTDPRDPQGIRALKKYFQLEIAIDDLPGYVHAGGRVHVRFQHGWEPLAKRWYRGLRRLFLSKFNV